MENLMNSEFIEGTVLSSNVVGGTSKKGNAYRIQHFTAKTNADSGFKTALPFHYSQFLDTGSDPLPIKAGDKIVVGIDTLSVEKHLIKVTKGTLIN